jgi:hypothetical protein
MISLSTLAGLALMAALHAEPARPAADTDQQGNRPQQAQQARGQQGNRPQQAQQARGQQGNRPQQAQQARGQQGNRPQQAQQERGQQGNRPQQAQQARGQQQDRAQQGRGQQGNRPQQAQQGRGPQQDRAQQAGQQRGPQADRARQGLARAADAARTRAATRAAAAGRIDALPAQLQQWARSPRAHERKVAGAALYGTMWGLNPADVIWGTRDDYVVVSNRRGDVLLQLDERRARELGAWDMRRMGDRRPTSNAPAFCRSGEGHPVWGREWCLDKGFGLGSRAGTIWSRSRVEDIIFRRPLTRDQLLRDALIGVVGDVVFNRLGLHALSMGYQEPLYGRWVAEPEAPQILYVYSGDVVIAEMVDVNRDNRADVLYVLQPL